MSNIKNDPNYDPFPKTGLVRQFKNAILGELTLFLKKYPKVSKQDALFKFVELAIDAEKRFKPELSYSFWTFCRPYLKGAFRELVDKERKYDQGLIHKSPDPREQSDAERAAEDKGNAEFKTREDCLDDASKEAKRIVEKGMLHAELDRRLAEEKLSTGAPEYGTGGNRTPVTLDMKGAIIGVRLYDNAEPHVRGVMDRLSSDLRILLGFEPPSKEPRLLGRMRAVVAHGERLQREADQEAENQQGGNYNPVFLEARDGLRAGIKTRQQKKRATAKLYTRPPRISEDPDLSRLDPVLREYSHADRVALLVGAAEALRPSLDDKARAVLDWLLDPRERNLTALAAEIDITKGYASKLRGRVLDLLGKRMTSAPEKCTTLIDRGCEILTNRLQERDELIRQGLAK